MGKRKINNKGFTLVELLAIIVVTGLVLGIGIYSVVNLVKGSKEKATLVSEASVKESASIYSDEASSSSWIYPKEGDYEYYCVTIEELINKGIIAKNATLPEGIEKTDYVSIKRNRVTFVKGEAVVLGKDADTSSNEYQVCTGSVFKEEVTAPSRGDSSSYTDMLSIEYKDGTAEESVITDKWCQYDVSSSIEPITDIEYGKNVVKISEDNKCNIEGLKDGTIYYVRVCMATAMGSRVCSDTEGYSTSMFEDPSYSVSGNGIKIKYYNTGVRNPMYYFKSNTKGTSNKNVSLCDDNFNCDGSTKNIEKDKWYKVDSSEVTIDYSSNSGISDGIINARIKDKSGNFKENSKEFRLYNVLFKAKSGYTIDGSSSDITRKCLAFKGDSCSVKSPSITKSCYSGMKWNTSSNNGVVTPGENASISYDNNSNVNITYSATDGNVATYTISYNANGGSGAPSSHTKTCGVNTSLSRSIPSRVNYNFNGWNTKSDGSGTNYSAGATYSGNSSITLYAKWSYRYYCSYTGKRYDSYSAASSACTVTTYADKVSASTTTYSCPSGYTCSSGACNSSSTCSKTVNGTITTKYYCSHNGSYQASSSCSYRGGERDYSCDLKCNSTGTGCTYTCPSNTALSGTKCIYYDYSCGSSYTKTATSTCDVTCSYGNVSIYSNCSYRSTCGGTLGCYSTCDTSSGDTADCRPNVWVGGSTKCSEKRLYECSKAATASGCDKTYSGGSCSLKSTTGSCASGYTMTETTCTNPISKDGGSYCDTRNYWNGKSCTSDYGGGATRRVDFTCTKTGDTKYYCSSDGKYYDSKPSNCSSVVTTSVVGSTTTTYSCPSGYTENSSGKCYRIDTYSVS